MIHPDLQFDGERLADICRRYGVRELCLFGSAVRDDFGPESDIDLLVELERRSWDDFFDLKFALEDLFGRPVDLIDGRDGIHNPVRRRSILPSLERLYAA